MWTINTCQLASFLEKSLIASPLGCAEALRASCALTQEAVEGAEMVHRCDPKAHLLLAAVLGVPCRALLSTGDGD